MCRIPSLGVAGEDAVEFLISSSLSSMTIVCRDLFLPIIASGIEMHEKYSNLRTMPN